jgi:hypothetical protein
MLACSKVKFLVCIVLGYFICLREPVASEIYQIGSGLFLLLAPPMNYGDKDIYGS